MLNIDCLGMKNSKVLPSFNIDFTIISSPNPFTRFFTIDKPSPELPLRTLVV